MNNQPEPTTPTDSTKEDDDEMSEAQLRRAIAGLCDPTSEAFQAEAKGFGITPQELEAQVVYLLDHIREF